MKNSKSIFLVEDDEDEQFLFIEALKEVKNATLYDVANNGKEALDKLEKSSAPPDLIFMDINMPVMDGIECLSTIIKNPKTKNIPVVILSTATEKKQLMKKLGAKAFLEKPWKDKIRKENIEQMINLDFITDSDIANQTIQPKFGSLSTDII